jgi:hypothetical protein
MHFINFVIYLASGGVRWWLDVIKLDGIKRKRSWLNLRYSRHLPGETFRVLSKFIQVATLFMCIREMSRFNLNQGPGFPHFETFPQFFQTNARIVQEIRPRMFTSTSFPVHYSPSSNHSTLYKFWVKQIPNKKLRWYAFRRSQWPRNLRHEHSSPAQTLGSWVRIPL